ncbi:hypothetical protein KIW84_066093 [Lathyrus oleraceus]|uniref:Uncharacterized protein n=1 Tax=Pisum sativum TaxID=3888 RepID=A0A9D4WEQ0_PEA|nr:hypothetical protein KIW84_066093 [Pisum sativum]
MGKLAFDVDFHPSVNLVATGLIDGDLHFHRYSTDNANSDPVRVLDVHARIESCRAARFIKGGRALLMGSPDFSILATNVKSGSTIARLDNTHEAVTNRWISLMESTIASIDDDDCIKVWDTREYSCYNSFEAHEDYISDITFASDVMKLLATSGDGTLSDCSDRFADPSSNSINTMLKLDEDRIITGSENGMINLVGIVPNRIIQPIDEHSEYPVKRLAFSHDRKFLGSIVHDQMLKDLAFSLSVLEP